MISCPRDVFRDALAYSVVAKAGAKKVHRPVPRMSGMVRDGGSSDAEVLEYALPGGETVARMVKACGSVECWLRPDLATETLIARSDAEAEKYRIIKEMTDQMNRSDAALAAARGETIEHFRTQRNYRGMRFDRYRAAQRAGRG